jgi:pimeloyl-ACP methyl ester carboxylesterase
MRPKRRWRKVIYFLLGLALAYFAGCFYLASKYVRPGVANDGPIPNGFHESSNPNAWISNDLPKSKSVFVLVHGYGGNQFGWRDVAKLLIDKDHGVVIPALPGHDNRLGETSGFAEKESTEVARTVDWIRAQASPGARIVLVGVSMGGAACWLATAKTSNIDAIATEGCFARLEPATNRWFDRKAPGASIYLAPVIWFAKKLSGVDPSNINPVEAAHMWKGKPSLVIHGSDDQLFDIADAKSIAEQSGGELWIVHGAGHAHCSDVDCDAYIGRLVKLLNRTSPGTQPHTSP